MKKKANKQTSVQSMTAWVVYFVGFEDDNKSDSASSDTNVEPRVGYEKFETSGNAEQQRQDAEMAAFLRGGQVLAVVDDQDEKVVQSVTDALEKQILRMR